MKLRKYKIIGELFEVVKRGKMKLSVDSSTCGKYPIVSSSMYNQGITGYSNSYDYNGLYVSISNTGSTGYCFVQNGKFSATSSVTIVKPIIQCSIKALERICYILTRKLNLNYSWNVSLTIGRLNIETVLLPEDLNILSFDENSLFDNIPTFPALSINLTASPTSQTDSASPANMEHMEYMEYMEYPTLAIKTDLSTKQFKLEQFKISDLFEYVIVRHREHISNSSSGNNLLISQKNENRAIAKYINNYEFEEHNNVYVSVSCNTGGFSYVQTGRFSLTEKMHLLKLRDTKLSPLLHFIAYIMTSKFTTNYGWHPGLSKNWLMESYIILPTIDGNITNESIESFISYSLSCSLS